MDSGLTAPRLARTMGAAHELASGQRKRAHDLRRGGCGLRHLGMWLDYGTGVGQPDAFDRALGARIHELTNVKIRHCLTMRPRAVHQADPEGRHVHSVSLHFSGCDRKEHDAGLCSYVPALSSLRRSQARPNRRSCRTT